MEKIKNYGFTFFDTKIKRSSINPFSQMVDLYRVYRIQKEFNPDVLYNLGAKAIFYGTFVSKIQGRKRYIVNAPIGLGYVFSSKSMKAKLLRPLVLFCYRLCLNPTNSSVIIENFDDIDFFVKKGYLKPANAFCILGAGVNTKKFRSIPFKQRNSMVTVVFAARLIEDKGVFDFVKLAERLYEKQIPVRMQVVGEPDYGNPRSISHDDFEALSKNPAIECLGFQPDMAPILQKAHICCFPSFYREGLPRILIEAASSGLAIITTNTVGCKEVVRGGNGFLVSPHDISRMESLINYLIENPGELQDMCVRSRQIAETYFDTQLICERTYRIIKKEGASV